MISKSNRAFTPLEIGCQRQPTDTFGVLSLTGFTLLEVVISVAILSTAIVFIFRAFTTVLSSVKLSQDIGLACFLAEDKLWEIEQRQKDGLNLPVINSGTEKIQEREFKWNYEIKDLSDFKNLKELKFTISWQENIRREEKNNINTYLVSKIQ